MLLHPFFNGFPNKYLSFRFVAQIIANIIANKISNKKNNTYYGTHGFPQKYQFINPANWSAIG